MENNIILVSRDGYVQIKMFQLEMANTIFAMRKELQLNKHWRITIGQKLMENVIT